MIFRRFVNQMNFLTKLFLKMPEMESERLKFRSIKKKDVNDIFEYASDPRTSKFLMWDPHDSLEYTKKFIEIVLSNYKSGEYNDWAIIYKENQKMIGTCGFTNIDAENSNVEIGYVLNPKYWNMGIATEVVQRVVEFAFENMKVNRVEAKFLFGNDASLAVMEKIGMKFEGYNREALLVKGTYKTVGVSSILRREYVLNRRYNESK